MAIRSILAVALFWAASLIALSALSRAADPFLGTFENDEGKIVVRSAGEGLYEGEVTLEGTRSSSPANGAAKRSTEN
jgi:hypothetical protein